MIDYKKIIDRCGAKVNIKYIPIIDFVELEIVSYCNLKCFACNRWCSSAPTNDQMSVEQVEKFVKESIDLAKKWKNIAIMGGEPSLHPNIKEIINVIEVYHKFSPSTRITFISNGIGDKTKKVLSELPNFIEKHATTDLKNTRDVNNVIPEFGNSLLAPIDRLKEISNNGIIDSCNIASSCGLGLNKYGYVACGCGAAIARVLGIDMFVKDLRDVSIAKSIEQLKIICLFCGRNLEYSILCQNDASISDFWKMALQEYNGKNNLEPY